MRKKKICTRCKKNKLAKYYRVREKIGYKYLNPTCLKCDAQLSAERYAVYRLDPQFRKKEAQRTKDWAIKNKKKKIEYDKWRRQQDWYKEYVKKYYKKNKVKIIEQHRLVSRKSAKKSRDNISESYIIRLLSHPHDGIGVAKDIKKYPEIIKLYQSIIKFKRLCKRKSQTLTR